MKPPDYTRMSPTEMLVEVADDGYKWAEAFCQTAEKLGLKYDQGWMIGWFCNAIEHSHAVRLAREEKKKSVVKNSWIAVSGIAILLLVAATLSYILICHE